MYWMNPFDGNVENLPKAGDKVLYCKHKKAKKYYVLSIDWEPEDLVIFDYEEEMPPQYMIICGKCYVKHHPSEIETTLESKIVKAKYLNKLKKSLSGGKLIFQNYDEYVEEHEPEHPEVGDLVMLCDHIDDMEEDEMTLLIHIPDLEQELDVSEEDESSVFVECDWLQACAFCNESYGGDPVEIINKTCQEHLYTTWDEDDQEEFEEFNYEGDDL